MWGAELRRPTSIAIKLKIRTPPRRSAPSTHLQEWKNSGRRSADWEDRLFRRREAVMEWVVKLETRNGWGEVETIEVGRLDRRVSGFTADEVGMRHCQV